MTRWTRDIVRSKLQDWQKAKLTNQQIWEWALNEWFPIEDDYEDLERSANGTWESICRDIIWMLEDLNQNHISKKDIPILLEYLDTPLGQYQVGKNRIDNYFENIDWNSRKQELIGVPPYSD